MNDAIHCPGCTVQLVLPDLPSGQTVACPRCQRVFEPTRQRTAAIPKIAAPTPALLEDAVPELLPPPPRPQPPKGTVFGFFALFFMVCVVLALVVDAYVNADFILMKLDAEMGPNPFQPMGDRTSLRATADTCFHLTFWPAFLFFLIWLYMAHANLPGLNAGGLSYTPLVGPLSFLFPIAQLFMPFVVLQEIWRASHPRAVETRLDWKETAYAPSIRYWWMAYFAALVFWGIAFHSRVIEKADMLTSTGFAAIADIFSIAAGVLLIHITYTIIQRQQERYRWLCELREKSAR